MFATNKKLHLMLTWPRWWPGKSPSKFSKPLQAKENLPRGWELKNKDNCHLRLLLSICICIISYILYHGPEHALNIYEITARDMYTHIYMYTKSYLCLSIHGKLIDWLTAWRLIGSLLAGGRGVSGPKLLLAFPGPLFTWIFPFNCRIWLNF